MTFSLKILVVLFLSAVLLSAKSSLARLKQINDAKFKPGQVWSYKTREGEEKSTLTILRTESSGEKTIVHIRVDDVHLRNCFGGNAPEQFEHMPFDKKALDASVVAMLRTVDVPDYREGYSDWRAGWDAGKAGIYTITVAQALEVAQYTFSRGIGCPVDSSVQQ